MARAPIEYIMSKPVHSVTNEDSVQTASDTMNKNGTKKILVKTKNGDPIGVLESWKITPKDYPKKVKDIPLGKIELMPKNTDVELVEKALAVASAVYITDPDNANAIIGVITTFDLYKSAE